MFSICLIEPVSLRTMQLHRQRANELRSQEGLPLLPAGCIYVPPQETRNEESQRIGPEHVNNPSLALPPGNAPERLAHSANSDDHHLPPSLDDDDYNESQFLSPQMLSQHDADEFVPHNDSNSLSNQSDFLYLDADEIILNGSDSGPASLSGSISIGSIESLEEGPQYGPFLDDEAGNQRAKPKQDFVTWALQNKKWINLLR